MINLVLAGAVYKSLKAGEHIIATESKEYSIGDLEFDEKTKKLVISFKKDAPMNLKTISFEASQIIDSVKQYLIRNKDIEVKVTYGSKALGTVKYNGHITILSKYLSKLQYLYQYIFNELDYMINKIDKSYVEDVSIIYLGAKDVMRSTIGIEFTTYNILLKEAENQVEQNFREILEIHNDTDIEHLPLNHFERLIEKHGYDTIMKALYEYALWCKVHKPELHEKVNEIILKLEEKYHRNVEPEDFIKDESYLFNTKDYIDELINKFYTTKSYFTKLSILATLETMTYYDLTKAEYINIASKFALPDLEIMLEAEQVEEKEVEKDKEKEANKIPKIPVKTQIDIDILALAIIATQSDISSVKATALYALNKLGIRDWLKEVNDKNLAIKMINSLLTVSTRFKLARLYTKNAINTLASASGNVTKKPSIKDTDIIELGQKIGAIMAYDAIR